MTREVGPTCITRFDACSFLAKLGNTGITMVMQMLLKGEQVASGLNRVYDASKQTRQWHPGRTACAQYAAQEHKNSKRVKKRPTFSLSAKNGLVVQRNG